MEGTTPLVRGTGRRRSNVSRRDAIALAAETETGVSAIGEEELVRAGDPCSRNVLLDLGGPKELGGGLAFTEVLEGPGSIVGGPKELGGGGGLAFTDVLEGPGSIEWGAGV